jgi:hypothetical protein
MTKHFAELVLCAVACGGGRNPARDAPAAGDSLYLTVENVGGHCNVTIGDLAPFTAAEETVGDFAPGQTIPLAASAMTGFTLGRWHHTTHDTGSGDPGTLTGSGAGAMTAAAVMLGDEPGCVWICCGSGSADCAVTDPCA